MAVASMRAVHLGSSFGASVVDQVACSSVCGESLRCSSSSSAGAPLRLQQKTALLQPVSVLLAAQLDIFGCIGKGFRSRCGVFSFVHFFLCLPL